MNTVVLLLLTNPACVFLGFLFGRMTRAAVEIEDRMVEEEPDADSFEGNQRQEERKRARWKRIDSVRIIAVIVAIIGLTTAWVGYNGQRNNDRIVGCVAGYSNALGDALDQRSRPQQEALDRIYEVMQTIIEAYATASPEAQEAVRTAIENAVESRAKAREALRDNPLPEVPRDACQRILD